MNLEDLSEQQHQHVNNPQG